MKQEKTIAIVGLGLLGASFAEALQALPVPLKIIGISSAPTLVAAQNAKIISEGYSYDEIDQWKESADLILLCTPIEHISAFLQKLSQSSVPFKKAAVLTDVGSSKLKISTLAKQLFKTQGVFFIPGHPMAGSEKSGFEARSPLLYESALWILCEEEDAIKNKAGFFWDLLKMMSVRVICMEAALHDRYMARISHVPQMLSTLLSHSLRHTPEAPAISGPGFRDMTRLAASPLWMWEPILKSNRCEILNGLKDFQQDLNQLILDLEKQNWPKLEPLFHSAHEIRASIPNLRLRQPDERFDVLITIANQPGKLDSVVEPIAQAGLNLVDIELLKNREGLGGTLRVSFSTGEEAERAVELLTKLNIIARHL